MLRLRRKMRLFFAEVKFRLMRFGDFPHEIGIFLGYPLEDVVPFLRCLQTGSN
ncbi:DUF3793 family protein [uncultured Treponema sp.]